MKTPALVWLGLVALPALATAADSLKITVANPLDAPRPAEMIAVSWKEVAQAIPGALLQHLAVRDSAGHSLPYQVTNIAPQAKDPKGVGIAYGELLFQHDFAAGEKTATFTVEKLAEVAPVFPTKAYARYVPERLDDFAWENDKIGHRTYGPALAAPDAEKTGKEVLVTSGLDVWCKRVSYSIVDRWYNKGHDHYHKDEGEGMDMYGVGKTCGCGGTGVWDGHKLYAGGNYKTWKVLANGPVRAIFELTYDTWTADGLEVKETKRFTVDAGHQLDQIESTFTAVKGGPEFVVAVGLNKDSADKKQEPKISFATTEADGSVTIWSEQKANGRIGTAVIVAGPEFRGFAEDEQNRLVLAKVTSGKPLRYFAGAAWSKAGEITTPEQWAAYVAAAAARARTPVTIAAEAVH